MATSHQVGAHFLSLGVLTMIGGCAPLGTLSPLLPVERAMVFHPVPYPTGNWSPSGLAVEDAWFQAEDGTALHGWYLTHPSPRGVALFCHGNAGNITTLADSLRILNERHRLSIMTFDYRGYGRSAGTPSEAGILRDARAARRWLAERTRPVLRRDLYLVRLPPQHSAETCQIGGGRTYLQELGIRNGHRSA